MLPRPDLGEEVVCVPVEVILLPVAHERLERGEAELRRQPGGRPDRLVVLVDGDGSFVMNSQELATVVENQLPVKMVIINNGGHGMVRQWQDIIYGGRFHSIDLSASPDFVKLAEAYGAVGIRASKPNEVVPALEKAFAVPGPVLVDVMVDRDEFCFPMVPAGGANKDMLLERPTKDVKAKAAKSQTGF